MLFLRYAVQYVNIMDLLLLQLVFAVHMKTCEFNKTVCRFSYLWAPPESVFTPQPGPTRSGSPAHQAVKIIKKKKKLNSAKSLISIIYQ